jgi:hypothetical protein
MWIPGMMALMCITELDDAFHFHVYRWERFGSEGSTGFELKALSLLGKFSVTWATPATLYAPVIFEIESCVLLCSLELWSYVNLPCSWDERAVPPHSAIGWEEVKFFLFCPNWPQTAVVPSLTSQVARIAHLSHCIQLLLFFKKTIKTVYSCEEV